MLDFTQPGGWVAFLSILRDEKGQKFGQDHAKLADFCVRLGLKWFGLRIGDRTFHVDPVYLRGLRDALHDRGVALVTWHYGLDPRAVIGGKMWNAEVDQIAMLEKDYGVDGHVLNFEVPWVFNGSSEWATRYCDALAEQVTIPIAHAPMGACDYHPAYPFGVFNARLACSMPQLYATELGRGSWDEVRTKWEPMWTARIAKHPDEAPVCPIANTYGRDTVIQGAPNLQKVPGMFDPKAFDEQLTRSAASPFKGWSLYTLECADPRAIQVLEQRASELVTAMPTPTPVPETLGETESGESLTRAEAKRADAAAKKAKRSGG